MTGIVVLGALAVALGGIGWARLLAARGWGLLCLAVYVFFVPLGDLLSLPLPGELSSPSTVFGLLTIGLLGVGLLQRRRSPQPLRALGCGLAFLGVAVASLLWTRSPADTLEEIIVLGGAMSVFFVVAAHDAHWRDVRRFERAAVAGAATVALAAMLSAALGTLAVGRSGVPRFATVGGDANATAASLILPFAIAVSRAYDETVSRAERIAMFVVAGVIFGGVALTVSRGGVIAAAAVLLLVILHGRNCIRRAVSTVVLLGAVATAVLISMPPIVGARFATTASSGRLGIWRLGLSACTRECGIGSGFGTFPSVYRDEFLTNPAASGFRDEAFKAHNVFLQMAVETGVVGVILFAATLVAATMAAWRLPAPHRAAPFAAMIGLLITNSFITNSAFKYFWLAPAYVALTATSARRARTAPRAMADPSHPVDHHPSERRAPMAPTLKVSSP